MPATPPSAEVVQLAGMSAELALEDGALVVTLSAPTDGWLAVGFDTDVDLAGTRLVMASWREGAGVVEEHVAAPPAHPRRSGGAMASWIAGERGSRSRVTLSVPLDPLDGDLPVLHPGEQVFLWLAWSHDVDLEHHSARREGAWATLPGGG